jgi:hypothetical protein
LVGARMLGSAKREAVSVSLRNKFKSVAKSRAMFNAFRQPKS